MHNVRPFHAPVGKMITDVINAAKAKTTNK
jgi:hypothetical protein